MYNFSGTPEGVLLPPALPAANDTGSVRWAGGKCGQTDKLAMLLPEEIENYAEPFVGGGNIFYHLRKTGRIKGKTYLSDISLPLINFYLVLQRNPEQVAKAVLHLHERCGRGNQQLFSDAVETINSPTSTDFEKAVAFFVHNTLVFSLATLNFTRKSAFAQSCADTRGLTLHNIRRLVANGKMLEGTIIECQDYRTAVEKLPDNTFLFLDSPYDGSKEETYCTEFDQNLYAANCKEWSEKFQMMVTLDAGVDSMRRFNHFKQIIRPVRYHSTKRKKNEQVSLNYQPSFLTDKLELLNWTHVQRTNGGTSDQWFTPFELLNTLYDACGVMQFDLDPCSPPEYLAHTKAKKRFCVESGDDGLAEDWRGKTIFMNPPYGRGIDKWVEKACTEVANGNAKTVIGLLPVKADTDWWHNHVAMKADMFVFNGRLKFGNAKGSGRFASALAIWGDTSNFDISKFGSDETYPGYWQMAV
ncbi:hypothetical protein GCM10011332_32940 [Terasakiella brassicae]|uniref:site-specific DNA-methyltransferase (adenine-specific) n=1 Tax=Terasakiella brassicae TaxID=1634917 RepID=A0A917FHE5_9PROT|nr:MULTISPECIES: DNA N-6-adenine-methyltransferase [Terasakiella]GGF76371.1 hypothetical protein GCM10011332_32940 [Terasakiella brassicae]